MLDQSDALKILEDLGAIITDGHFVYASGRHGSVYVAKKRIYQDEWQTKRICNAIAAPFTVDFVDVVIGPESGGVIIAAYVAEHLRDKTGRDILPIGAHKGSDGTFTVETGFGKFLEGKNVLIVDDVVTTGGTVRSVIETVRSCGANIVGVGAIFNRGNISKKALGDVYKFFALININFPDWETPCPLCQENIPLTPVPDKEI